jgi:hypothetical protein
MVLEQREAHADWTERTFALGVDVPYAASGELYVVWSPVLRRHASLAVADARFLQEFADGVRLADRLPELVGEVQRGRPNEAPSSLLGLYLRVQRYLLLGVLVEELVLTPDKIGALCIGNADGDSVRVRDGPIDLSELPKHRELRVCQRPDGQLAVLDGSAAAYQAYVEGRAQRVQVLQPAEFVRQLVDLPSDFFGTMRGDVPYQSVFCNGDEFVAGRRRALYERLALVRHSDLHQKAVLDLGCNIGMNCYLAVELGARLATGVDRRELASAAARLNGFYGRPCRFVAADVNEALDGIGRHDTVFVFSILGHLHSAEGVLQTIEHAQAHAVYVETHREGEPQGDLDRFLSAPLFTRVEFVGHCDNGAAEDQMTRRLYRCEVGGGSG